MVDISGAYLNAYLSKGISVHMRLDRTMTGFITNIDAKYKKHVDAGGGVIVLLKKALYGCVESAGRWYENLNDTMSALGIRGTSATSACLTGSDRMGSSALRPCTWTTC